MLRGAFYAFLIIFCLLPIKKKMRTKRSLKKSTIFSATRLHWLL
jgi:hypothetical protein